MEAYSVNKGFDKNADNRFLSDTEFLQVQKLMQRECGVYLDHDRQSMISTRLRPRLRITGCHNYSSYLELVKRTPAELNLFIDALTTHETYFFREKNQFEHLMNEVKTRQLKDASIWSAACSMGHEVYTAAMLMNEFSPNGSWKIIGTDIALDTLNKAKSGEYNVIEKTRIFDNLYQLSCSENSTEKTFRFNDKILSRVDFQHFNLMHRFQAKRFDFVFLRNVLIYFNEDDQKRIVENVIHTLKPDGIIYFGHSEQLIARHSQLEKVGPGAWKKMSENQNAVTPIKCRWPKP